MKGFDRKLFSGILVMMLLFLPLIAGSIFSLRKIISAQNELIFTYSQELFLARDLQRYVIQQSAAMPVYVLTGDEKALVEFQTASQNFTDTLNRLSILETDTKSDAMLDEIGRIQARLYTLAMPGIDMKAKGASIEAVNEYFRRATGPTTEELSAKLNTFVKYTFAAYENEKNGNSVMSQRLLKFLGVASGLTIFFLLAVCALLLKLVRQRRAYEETNRRLIRREQELSKARKEAVEVVAHDLKNPLASVIMNAQIALRKASTGPDSRRTFELTLKSAQSMKRLIDDLLDHTKIESGSLQIHETSCNLESLLHAICERFDAIAASQNKKLFCKCAPSLPNIWADEARIEQVISNILGNALKFTPEGGEIRIALARAGESLQISVSDTGVGMSAEEAEHAFERYWQGRIGAHKGTGLGLAISNAIVKAHGGSIRIESKEGEGSTFVILLPLREAPLPAPPAEAGNSPGLHT